MKNLKAFLCHENRFFVGLFLVTGISLTLLTFPFSALADGIEPTPTPTETQTPVPTIEPTEAPTEAQPDVPPGDEAAQATQEQEENPLPTDGETEEESLSFWQRLTRTNQCLVILIVLVVIVITLMVVAQAVNRMRG
jgi:hypothetical protein